MLIAAQIINRALRILRVVDRAETPEAEDFETAVAALNALGRRWAANGLFEQWQTVVEPEDVLTVSDNAEDALCFGLALRLRPEYGLELAADVVATAQQSLAYLWRDRIASFNSATVGGTISRALRFLISNGQSPDDYNLSGALEALNTMMRRWEGNGLALGWNDVEELDERLPAPPEAQEAIAFNLALKLAPEYGVEPAPSVVVGASEGLAALRRDVLVANPLEMRSRLPRARRYNMITDEYEP